MEKIFCLGVMADHLSWGKFGSTSWGCIQSSTPVKLSTRTSSANKSPLYLLKRTVKTQIYFPNVTAEYICILVRFPSHYCVHFSGYYGLNISHLLPEVNLMQTCMVWCHGFTPMITLFDFCTFKPSVLTLDCKDRPLCHHHPENRPP